MFNCSSNVVFFVFGTNTPLEQKPVSVQQSLQLDLFILTFSCFATYSVSKIVIISMYRSNLM